MVCNLPYIKMLTQQASLQLKLTLIHIGWNFLTSNSGSKYQEFKLCEINQDYFECLVLLWNSACVTGLIAPEVTNEG